MFIRPMKAVSLTEQEVLALPPDEYVFTLKYDGVSAIYFPKEKVPLWSVQGKPIANRNLQEYWAAMPPGLPNGLQFEIVRFGENGPLPLNETVSLVNSHMMPKGDVRWFPFGIYGEPVLSREHFHEMHYRACGVMGIDIYDDAAQAMHYARLYQKEGIMARRIGVPYKHGRATAHSRELCKHKFMLEGVATVIDCAPLLHNHNVQTINERGYASRSSHAANKEVDPTRMGALVVLCEGTTFNIGSGFTDALRRDVAQRPGHYIGREVEFEYMPCAGFAKFRQPIFKRFVGDI